MNNTEADRKLEEYNGAVARDMLKMLSAGCRFTVIPDVQKSNLYDTGWVVVLDPNSINPTVGACDMVTVGKFWVKEHANLFAHFANKYYGRSED